MAFIQIQNVSIRGIAACVPETVEENISSPVFESDIEANKFIKSTGIERRHITTDHIVTSDLAQKAAEKLIEDLNWEKESIDCLIFVSQSHDYVLPATACILQNKLGLSEECYAIDISLGCSGWVYALSVITSLLSHNNMKRGLLLAGDTTTSSHLSPTDKACRPLFGDAATATALEFDTDADALDFHFGTDGSGYEAIIVPDGGARNPFSVQSLEDFTGEDNIVRNRSQLVLNGMDVFSFGISKAPMSVEKLLSHYSINKDEPDYYVFHQANLFMNETIRKKLKLPVVKVPYSLKNYGNTSSASIPLTLVTELKNELTDKQLSFIACGFGVGLSWGSVFFKTQNIVCPDLLKL